MCSSLSTTQTNSQAISSKYKWLQIKVQKTHIVMLHHAVGLTRRRTLDVSVGGKSLLIEMMSPHLKLPLFISKESKYLNAIIMFLFERLNMQESLLIHFIILYSSK